MSLILALGSASGLLSAKSTRLSAMKLPYSSILAAEVTQYALRLVQRARASPHNLQ